MPGLVEYLFNYCANNGCWVTDEERQLFAAGKVREGYALSCKNGDGYTCSALRVVNEAGALETLTNMRLETSLINNGVVRSRYEAIPIMDAIKVDLGRAYVDYLDSLGASPSNPQWPARAGIANFHDQVFQNYGAGKVFGGRISDSLIPRGWFDWCSTCKK